MNERLIEVFFNKKLITNTNTQRSYRSNIRLYFRLLGKNIESYFDKGISLDTYENDLNKIYLLLEKQNTPLLTRKTFFNSIKQFMCSTDKKLKQLDFWDILKTRVRGASPISKEFVPNNKDIKTVLAHGNALSRSMYLIMASTGCRIGELLALYPEDIDTTVAPTRIEIRRNYDRKKKNKVNMLTKTRKTRKCFLTNEATEAYHAWMKERDNYLTSSIKKTNPGYRPVKLTGDPEKDKKILDEYVKNEKRVFPMCDENARTIWAGLVKKSGLYETDTETKRLTLHPHCIRKFFRSYLGNADLADHLMGHATGMDKYYRNMKPEDLQQEFMKYMQNITILEVAPDLTDVHEQLKEKDTEIKDLKQQMHDIHMELLEVKLKQVQELQRNK